jgi:hypothetical protein
MVYSDTDGSYRALEVFCQFFGNDLPTLNWLWEVLKVTLRVCNGPLCHTRHARKMPAAGRRTLRRHRSGSGSPTAPARISGRRRIRSNGVGLRLSLGYSPSERSRAPIWTFNRTFSTIESHYVRLIERYEVSLHQKTWVP